MPLQNRLKELRARDGLTQEELAKRVGVSRQTIIAIEQGDYTPSLALGMRIAQASRLPLEDVFSLTE